jgi:hypothetical protein
MNPVDPYTGTQQVILQFFVRRAGFQANLGVRGFEVWRSIGNRDGFVRIMTRNYATNTAGDPFLALDRTPSLVAEDVWYRDRAFNGNPANGGFSQFSADVRTKPMPPSTTAVSPNFEPVSPKLWPTFRFRPTNPLMADKDITDAIEFTLLVKNLLDPNLLMLCPMQVDFRRSELFDESDPDSAINEHRFGFPLGMPVVLMRRVTEYNFTTGAVGGDWYPASDAEDIGGTMAYTPFAYLDGDGDIVIDTDSPRFRFLMNNYVRQAWGLENETFMPGATYHWCIFGRTAGVLWNSPNGMPLRMADAISNGALFTKGMNANGQNVLAVSYGSSSGYGLGWPDGFIDITIDPNAK